MGGRTNRPMNLLEWAMLLTLSVLWGGSFFFVEVCVEELPPFTIVVARVGLAALTLGLMVRMTGKRMPRDATVWRSFLFMGIVNNIVPFSLIVWGQTHIASGLASILNATTPLFTVIVAHCLTQDERLTGARILGVALGITGVAFMIGREALAGFGDNVVAQLACLGGAFSYACAGVYGRRFKRMNLDPMVTATGQVQASAFVLLPLALMVDRPWTIGVPSPQTWAALIGLAVFATAFAYILYFRILATAGATNLLLVTFLIPVSAILLGVVVLGERLEAVHAAGMALIGLGLASIDGRIPRALLARRRTVFERRRTGIFRSL